ncbi:glycoside hydrolase family 43 protein [Fibrella sp. HMF5335]|uniref:Glycoside hydrolase family 43 protein n=1 Tax=Fibrella rubiginis TaxID=2817060 RepID=A0A939GKZ0_9BACT|nr:glycoside hydrolase family 43 protein [Fibrella rubiginis]MBO0938646.1 glycoside hydrolase family 43 protein [Fibrella rubiginis]
MPHTPATFTNPLLPYGPDPWVVCHNGYYYYTHSTRTNLTIWKVRQLGELRPDKGKVVWTAPASGPLSANVWAPELHYLDNGKGGHCWYAYLCAADKKTPDKERMFVLENKADDPTQGAWTLKGELKTPDDKWAIDATVTVVEGQLYMAWSGWPGDENGQQNIYMCLMTNPWTCKGERLLLSEPTYPWELHNEDADPQSPRNQLVVNEGPAFLRHGDQLFLAYSASGCWTDEYAIGLLMAPLSSNLMDIRSWTKRTEPVFKTSVHNGVYGPGHGCFFCTESGQTWLLYHANPGPGKGCENERSPRLQRIHWHHDGLPDFGIPTAEGRVVEIDV